MVPMEAQSTCEGTIMGRTCETNIMGKNSSLIFTCYVKTVSFYLACFNITHFYRIREEGGSGSPPRLFENR